MNDLELLELAALSIGLKYTKPAEGYSGNLGLAMEDSVKRYLGDWNPLVEDGDALRLAVMIGFPFEIDPVWECEREEYEDDPFRATRKAIVRCAAAIGKAME